MNKKIITGIIWALFIGFALTMLVAGTVDTIAWGWPAALLMTLIVLILVFAGALGAVALIKGLARISFWLFVALAGGIPEEGDDLERVLRRTLVVEPYPAPKPRGAPLAQPGGQASPHLPKPNTSW